jgi:hypothetical protein
MSKTEPKKRKTRLKGNETKRPCFDCGKTKDRFKDFKPRWAGCVQHRTPNGRRYFQPGCLECKALVNGNIRQPRCIACDALRPKRRSAAAAAPTPVAVEPTPAPEPVAVEPTPEPEPEAVEPTPEPVVEVVGQPEPSPESVKLPEPEAPKPVAKPKPVATSAADIFKMLEDADAE